MLAWTLEWQALTSQAKETQVNHGLTWTLFHQELSAGEGNMHAMRAFEDHWQGHTLEWTGSVLRVDSYDDQVDQDDDFVWIGDTQHRKHQLSQVEILIEMPQNTLVVLSFDTEHFKKNKDTID